VIIEGPNRPEELDIFFNQGIIPGDWQCAVQSSGAQSIGIAVRTDLNTFSANPIEQYDTSSATSAPLLKKVTDEFKMDTDRDGLEEVHKFERKPLYVQLNLNNGKAFRIMGVHLKSKGIFSAIEWAAWWAKSEGNRKKLLAQCYQLRNQFLDKYLTEDNTKDIPLIVCGDINDGPGFDASEMKLLASGVETLMGSIWKPDLTLGNVIYDGLVEKKKNKLDFSDIYTASFPDPIIDKSYLYVWIDHILYSHKQKNWISKGKIWDTMAGDQKIYKKYPCASDHYPVTCAISIN
jgi:hypothetical protein